MYQKAAAWVGYIIAFVNLHNLFMVVWSKFHADVFNSGMVMHAYAAMIHEVARESFNAKWAKWIMNVVTMGVFDVSPRGIVTKSELSYDYMRMYNEQIKGRFLDTVSKMAYHMIMYMIKISGKCSKAALEVFAKILEPRTIIFKPVHKMFVILFIVSSSIAMVQMVIAKRRTLNSVRRSLPTTIGALSARIYQMVTSIPILKRKRALNPTVNVHRAMRMASRTLKPLPRSPTRYFNANSNNEYYNAMNHNTVDNVASMFERLSLSNR
jgi:hypothetical protein